MDKKIIDNRYVPIREIGSGGFASVFKAWASNLERFVAVKRVHESFSRSAKFLDMFRIEAINTAKLDHPNIIRVIDFLKTVNNIYYIIMEYVKGPDLRQLLLKCAKREVKLPYQITAYIIGEILKALEFAYSHVDEISGKPLNIVHRDISPGNIMVYYDGKVKLGDFGIAKVSTSLSESHDSGKLKGKVPYMSPEQAEGSPDLDNRSDIFSAGIVMYELLTGKKLFEAGSEYDTWKMVRKVKINPRLLDVNSNAPGPLKAIVLKALSKDKNERYQNAIEMLKDITNYMGGEEYNIQKGNLKKFLGHIFAEEIELENKETEHPAMETEIDELPLHNKPSVKDDDDLPEESKKQPVGGQPAEGDAGERTVIDFVLDTAKKYEKIFFKASLAALLLITGLFAADVYFAWTNIGISLHDKVWPPALVIESYPAGAALSLKDAAGREMVGLSSLTPVRMDKISPGNYSLTLSKEGFNPVSRKISIVGSSANISGGSVQTSASMKNKFVIKLESRIRVSSNPPGAGIKIDGKMLSQKTPLSLDIEAGKHTISLSMEGFKPLGSTKDISSKGQCILDLVKSVDDQKGIDKRFWSINKVIEDGITVYEISGTFWKDISINSNPQGAVVKINNEPVSIGKTPLEDISFQVGSHTIELSMAGFRTRKKDINVNADVNEKIFMSLKKRIRFETFGEDSKDKDINARITIKAVGIRNKLTPRTEYLPLKKLKAVFSKEPRYKPTTKTFNVHDVSNVKATLKLRNPFLQIKVVEEKSLKPVPNATIIMDGKYIGETNSSGIWKDYISIGEHLIIIDTNNVFPVKEIKKYFDVATKEKITITLSSVADGTLIIDARPHFSNAQIYVDGKFEGETFIKRTGIARGQHKVVIRHFDLETELEKTIDFNENGKRIILKLNEYGEIEEK